MRRMFAEQVEDSRDSRILPGFGLDDLDSASLQAYRNMFVLQKPDHPWNAPDDQGFLRLIGGWRKDRHTGKQGLTLAGLLMFGQWQSISEAAPLYFLDYQEQDDRPSNDTRWLDRVVPDGTWSGNLFDFFRKVSRKLVADLKVPFMLKDGFRQDDTPLHQALREALVNTLVHADYSDRASVRVIKRPSGFEFRNPGLLRVPAKAALQGGESDCRNRTLQQMFLMINLGERAGSGLPKIRQAWLDAGGQLELSDSFEPYDQTLLRMEWHAAGTKVPEQTSEISSEITSEITSEKSPDDTATRILALLRSDPSLSARKLAMQLQLSARAVELQLAKLKTSGQLQRVGSARGGHWRVLD